MSHTVGSSSFLFQVFILTKNLHCPRNWIHVNLYIACFSRILADWANERSFNSIKGHGSTTEVIVELWTMVLVLVPNIYNFDQIVQTEPWLKIYFIIMIWTSFLRLWMSKLLHLWLKLTLWWWESIQNIPVWKPKIPQEHKNGPYDWDFTYPSPEWNLP